MIKRDNSIAVDCACNDWNENIPLVNISGFRLTHNMDYTGKRFDFCPWCGKPLKRKEITVEK